jgi:hypothetical protein
MADAAQTRIAKNDMIFREANEHIRAKADEYQVEIDRLPFLCECPREDCTELVRMTLPEYSRVRANASHFFTLPEHADDERPLGTVIRREGTYVIVEKDTSLREP